MIFLDEQLQKLDKKIDKIQELVLIMVQSMNNMKEEDVQAIKKELDEYEK